MAKFMIKKGPRRVEVESPHQLVGVFLTMEATGPGFRRELLAGLRSVREGRICEYSAGRNAYEIRVLAQWVQVVESGDYNGGQDVTCEISLTEFEEIARAWDQKMGRWQKAT